MELFFAVSLEIVKLSNCQIVIKGHFEALILQLLHVVEPFVVATTFAERPADILR